jgi:hypothetical protein
MWRDEPLRWRRDRTGVVAAGALMTSRADWGNRQRNSQVSLGSFLNEINSLGRRFASHQRPHQTRQESRSCGAFVLFRGPFRLNWRNLPSAGGAGGALARLGRIRPRAPAASTRCPPARSQGGAPVRCRRVPGAPGLVRDGFAAATVTVMPGVAWTAWRRAVRIVRAAASSLPVFSSLAGAALDSSRQRFGQRSLQSPGAGQRPAVAGVRTEHSIEQLHASGEEVRARRCPSGRSSITVAVMAPRSCSLTTSSSRRPLNRTRMLRAAQARLVTLASRSTTADSGELAASSRTARPDSSLQIVSKVSLVANR